MPNQPKKEKELSLKGLSMLYRSSIAFSSCKWPYAFHVLTIQCNRLICERLLFMTYNGWVMLAVAVGAFVGYIVFGRDSSSAKSVACH